MQTFTCAHAGRETHSAAMIHMPRIKNLKHPEGIFKILWCYEGKPMGKKGKLMPLLGKIYEIALSFLEK
jgi:hypothetical protein